jgi:(p)ppGpp synthase/HD superfamily hydrolase
MTTSTPTRLTPRFDAAMQYALEIHRRQERKGSGIPYATHLLGTAAIVLHYGGSEEQAIAALLHDAAEDQGGKARLEDIRTRFGDTVARIVEACTDTLEDPKPEWGPRKQAYIARIATEPREAWSVSAADKLDNARAIVADLRVHGAALWERFTGGERSLGYYSNLVNAFRKAGGGPLVEELARMVEEMKRLAGEARKKG